MLIESIHQIREAGVARLSFALHQTGKVDPEIAVSAAFIVIKGEYPRNWRRSYEGCVQRWPVIEARITEKNYSLVMDHYEKFKGQPIRL